MFVGSNMKFSALVVIFISCHVCIANAQSSGPAIAGAGRVSCGKYLIQKSDPAIELMVTSWVQGFLSGMNVAKPADLPSVALPDNESIAAYIDKFCRDYPLESPAGGAIQLYLDLRESAKH